MKPVRADLSKDLENLELHIFADWHIGDANCNMHEITEEIEEVQNNPNAYVICNGDLMNNATKTSVSDCYAEKIPPQEQIDALVEMLKPIKDKILILTAGNHEARTYRADGIDLTAIVAMQLGISDKYVRESGVLFLRFGTAKNNHGDAERQTCYTLFCTHGSGGGRKEGAKAIRLADMAAQVDCDIYVHSHTHLPMIMRQSFFRIDVLNSCTRQIDKLFVNTSSKLKYGGYGETFEFKPNSTECPIIYLDGKRKHYTARL